MSFPNFPTLDSNSDSSKFAESMEDPAIRASMEGGYNVTRARFTRAPRKTWTVGYTYITDEEKVAITDFAASVRGGSNIFNWVNPANNVVYLVRFKEPPDCRYRGAGATKRWDVTFKLEQA